jgi:plastocyanin
LLARCLFAALLLVPLAAAQAADPPQEVVIRNHVFVPAELRVKAGQPVVLQVKNQDATAEEFESSALKVEKVVAGHGEVTVRIRPLKPGRYEFVGEYHEDTARGVLVAE